MPTSMSFGEHVEALQRAGRRLGAAAAAAGEMAAVPTCPAWDVRALLAHQTMVHRWATAHLIRSSPDDVPNQTSIRESEPDLLGYFESGLDALVAALHAAPDDLAAMTFLNDAPPPKQFWARRQAHETTIHMVDALAATLGRLPATDESGVPTDVAVDGIDELIRGFYTRGRSKLFDGEPLRFVVAPADSDRRWVVDVAERLTVADGDASPAGAGSVTLTGSAAGLYLALWNRGDGVEGDGAAPFLERWHAAQRVRWS
jgi:uncharacterized protein (TIGR03083 family)